MRPRLAVSFALGFGLVLGAGLALRDAPPEAPGPAVEVASAPSPGAVVPQPAAAPPGLDPRRVRILQERSRIEAFEAERRLLIGDPEPWTDQPAAVRVEAVESTLRALASELGGELVAVECDEYPCTSVLRFHVDAGDDARLADVQDLPSERIAASGAFPTGTVAWRDGADGASDVFVQRAFYAEQPDRLLDRERARSEALLQAAMDDAIDEQASP